MLTTKPSPLLRLANRWKRRYYRRKVARALAHADLVTGDNQCLVDCMADWFGIPVQKLELLHWGVEPELFQASESQLEEIRQSLGILPGQKVVMSPRGAKPVYQADIILRAFAEVLATGRKDAFFLFLGAGYPVSPEIGTAAESLSESYPNFKFIPHGLPREQIHALWNLVDIFVSAPVYDGYSAALAEGRYVGAIPLVNDIPAHREFITHLSNGWICKPFDAPTLASDLAHLIEHSGIYRQKFAPVNREWIMAHSVMETNAQRFLELLGNRFPSLRTGRRDG
jgi:glycosyltransferase involved in cell wall biosynthesis